VAPDPKFDDLLATAHDLADQAGAVIMPHFRSGLEVHHKGGATLDPVTAADLAAETAIRESLSGLYPDHGVLGEEFAPTATDAEYCWVVDPIDGTRAFIMGQPLWGTLIGVLRHGQPVLGLMNQPFTGERFWSGRDDAVYRHGGAERRMHTRACATLDDALLAATSPDLFTTEEEQAGVRAISSAVRLTRYGGDCYNYCLLALGQLDLVVEAGLKAFDILPLVPIVEKAGGVVSTWDGGDPRDGGRILAAGDPRLHALAVDALRRGRGA
jgi:myo-inositol-1(or 4)-monophosphatase